MTTPAWKALAAYAADQQVQPATWNGYYFACQTPGQSGTTEPTWDTSSVGATTNDGSVVWVCVGLQSADYAAFQVGAVTFPLNATSTNALLQDADPALFYALDFWTWLIRQYVGPRLVQVFESANLTFAGQPIKDAVAGAPYPYEPLPEQLENQFQFPLFAAYRRDIQTEWQTVGYESDSTSLEVVYILPPLDAAQSEQILPVFSAIAKLLRRKTTDAWDPNYTPPGGTRGDQITTAPYANTQELGFGEYRGFVGRGRSISRMGSHGFLEVKGGELYFPCLKLLAYAVERDEYNPTIGGPAKVAGADVSLGLVAGDGSVVPNVVQVSTQAPPTLVSLSPATGPIAGGTVVTLTGSLFLSGPPRVFFGPSTDPQYAPTVSFVSPQQLVIQTPAAQGAGPVDVTVINRDGQLVTLPQSFTFT